MKKENKANKSISIIFDDLTEFYTLRPIIDRLKKNHADIDIIVPFDSGYNGLPEHTINTIKSLGYNPKNDAKETKKYKILLTPYPNLHIVDRIKFTYHLKYSYGVLSAKPDPTYYPEWKVPYDGILSYNTYEAKLFNAYGVRTHTLPYWKYNNLKKSPKNSEKPVLLILPTFGKDINCLHLFTKTSLSEIKKHYKIITKAHHAIHFNLEQDDSIDILKEMSDEYYDSDAEISSLLGQADLVLSDNSGAIFEAIYAEVPIAVFTKNLNQRKIGNLNTLQHELVEEGLIPFTDQPDKILPMLQGIDKYTKKQLDLKKKLFVAPSKDPLKDYVDILDIYLNSDETTDKHKIMHDLLVQERTSDKKTIEELTAENESLRSTIQEKDLFISDLVNSTSWKITKPLRLIKSAINKERNENGTNK